MISQSDGDDDDERQAKHGGFEWLWAPLLLGVLVLVVSLPPRSTVVPLATAAAKDKQQQQQHPVAAAFVFGTYSISFHHLDNLLIV